MESLNYQITDHSNGGNNGDDAKKPAANDCDTDESRLLVLQTCKQPHSAKNE